MGPQEGFGWARLTCRFGTFRSNTRNGQTVEALFLIIIFSFRESKVHNTVLDYCLLTTEERGIQKKKCFFVTFACVVVKVSWLVSHFSLSPVPSQPRLAFVC